MFEDGKAVYIGDGLYAKYDSNTDQIMVYTWDGIESKNRIFLDFSVRQYLRKFIDQIDVRENHGEV